MISSKKKTSAVNTLPWPDCYYAEANPDLRIRMLEEHMDDEGEQAQNAFRKRLYDRRYTTQKSGHDEIYVDLFLQAYLMMRVSANQGLSLFRSRKKAAHQWQGYMRQLCMLDFPCKDETETELLHREWTAFLLQEISLCVEDRSYRSSLFGLLPMREDALADKIAEDLELVAKTFPQVLELSEAFAPFYACAEKAYEASVIK